MSVQVLPAREIDDIADDLVVLPLDSRVATGDLYEEEIELLARGKGGVGRSCGSCGSSAICSSCSSCSSCGK